MRSEMSVGCTIAFIIVGCTVIVSMMAIQCDKYSCSKIGKQLGYKYEYDMWTGCILENSKGHKFLLDQLRNLQVQEEE